MALDIVFELKSGTLGVDILRPAFVGVMVRGVYIPNYQTKSWDYKLSLLHALRY